MKKIFLLICLLSLTLWLGCGKDGPTEPDVIPDKTIQINSTAGDPGMTSANSSVWTNVDTVRIDITKAAVLPKMPAKLLKVSETALLQVIVNNGFLFMRIQWDDETFNVWPDYYFISDSIGLPHFRRNTIESEDQLYLFFKNPDTTVSNWDAFNWRVLTTGGAGFAEGYIYSRADSLELDTVGTSTNDKIAWENHNVQGVIGEPIYVHQDTSEFTDYLFDYDMKINRFDDPVGIMNADTTIVGEDTTIIIDYYYWPVTTGWIYQQKVPGWMINTDFGDISDANRGSRWDTRTVSDYDPLLGKYTLVMKVALNSGYSDDYNMTGLDSIQTKIVILNDQKDLYNGSTWRGTGEPLWLIF